MLHKELEQLSQSRRKLLTTALAGGCGLIPIASAALATGSHRTEMNPTHLINALRSIGKPICIDAANRLAEPAGVESGFDLHLRRAELNEADALVLADGMLRSNAGNGLLLKSFSASFNPDLGDIGAEALIKAFPESVTELGLVGCSLGDASGRAILEWARIALQIRMICIEGNRFSIDMQSQLNALAPHGRHMLVVV